MPTIFLLGRTKNILSTVIVATVVAREIWQLGPRTRIDELPELHPEEDGEPWRVFGFNGDVKLP